MMLRGNHEKKSHRICREAGQLLRKFRETEQFLENVGQKKYTIYFIIGLYKFLKKYLKLKKSTLSVITSERISKLFQRISTILSLYGRIRVSENPYSHIFYAVKKM